MNHKITGTERLNKMELPGHPKRLSLRTQSKIYKIGVHFDRVACCHCNHRHSRGHVAASLEQGEGTRAGDRLFEQHQAIWPWFHDVWRG